MSKPYTVRILDGSGTLIDNIDNVTVLNSDRANVTIAPDVFDGKLTLRVIDHDGSTRVRTFRQADGTHFVQLFNYAFGTVVVAGGMTRCAETHVCDPA